MENSPLFSVFILNMCHFSSAFIFSYLQNGQKSQKTWLYPNKVMLFCKGERSYWKSYGENEKLYLKEVWEHSIQQVGVIERKDMS